MNKILVKMYENRTKRKDHREWNRGEQANHRSLLASLSDSSRVRISPSLTGPFTFLMMNLFWSSRNLTRTWVTWPLDPVLPITFTTTACFTWDSILHKYNQEIMNIYANYWKKKKKSSLHGSQTRKRTWQRHIKGKRGGGKKICFDSSLAL